MGNLISYYVFIINSALPISNLPKFIGGAFLEGSFVANRNRVSSIN